MDPPLVVDPIRNDYWIYNGSELHTQGKERGLAFEDAIYESLLNWHAPAQGPVSIFKPTTKQIDKMHKFCTPRGDRFDPISNRPGVLPVISKLHYDGALGPHKSAGDIEHEMREAARHEGARLFDKSGAWR